MVQSVNAAFTAEEKDSVRTIASSAQVAWHKQSTLGNRTFTIGVSTIGGSDVIGINPGAIGSPSNYKYFDESAYVTSMAWERGYSMPAGGMTKALAEIHLDNTSSRFTPRYMGGRSELYTADPLRAPLIINAGFNLGPDITIPQFVGIITEQPKLSLRDKTYDIKAADYIDYFQEKFLDNNAMYTGLRSDQIMENLSITLGMNTAQYVYDQGINTVPFAFFPSGTSFSDIFGKLVEAEMGHFYQDESGIFRFENRQHWQNPPYTQIQKVINTSQVIDAQSPNVDHLINVVEINSNVRAKQPNQIVFTLSAAVAVPGLIDTDIFVNFDDPVLQITSYDWTVNSAEDGTGTDLTSNVTLKAFSAFAQAAKFTFTNSSSTDGFVTQLTVMGRPAKITNDIYYRASIDSSVTAYQEQKLSVDNDFISTSDLAETLASIILQDFSLPENIQTITIRAIPELQLGDYISWQGKYWRLFDIKTTLDPSVGFIQELMMLQRNPTSYFTIGVSTIGGGDLISA